MANAFGQLAALAQAGSRSLGGRARGIGNLTPPSIGGIRPSGQRPNALTGGFQPSAFPGQTLPNGALHPGQGHNLIPTGQLGNAYGSPAPQTGPPAPVAHPPAQAPQPSPLDATYWANVNANQFNTNNKINSLGQSETDAGTALQSALAKLDYAQPRASLALEEAANRRGGLYSSVYNQQLGDQNYQYAGQRGGLASNFAQTLGNDQSQIAALQGGIGLYNDQQAADAAIRASNLAQRLPAPPPAQAPAGSAPAARPPSIASRDAGASRAAANLLNGHGPARTDAGQTRAGRQALRSVPRQEASTSSKLAKALSKGRR